jgi:hypothetical protein
MLFNSLDFFIFLAVVLPLYFVLPLRARQIMLVCASFYFYMYWYFSYSLISGRVITLGTHPRPDKKR